MLLLSRDDTPDDIAIEAGRTPELTTELHEPDERIATLLAAANPATS